MPLKVLIQKKGSQVTNQTAPLGVSDVVLHCLPKTNYTPGIHADGYIVFAFPFVCSFVCSFVSSPEPKAHKVS